ncbi:hypothetical protein L6452_39634 [Arctium lappa]|uniref:Uncharacterized protein n=1 Tax=Arctium lappa TaxID=4217 RepID=A0ACB8XTB3_ARCLA|nr:hypothetical protein L6452_39634 [Arctium lappa]
MQHYSQVNLVILLSYIIPNSTQTRTFSNNNINRIFFLFESNLPPNPNQALIPLHISPSSSQMRFTFRCEVDSTCEN